LNQLKINKKIRPEGSCKVEKTIEPLPLAIGLVAIQVKLYVAPPIKVKGLICRVCSLNFTNCITQNILKYFRKQAYNHFLL